jgi:hypothetical protein
MPVILATQEAEIMRIAAQSQPAQIARETLSQKTLSQKIGFVEWLKVKALISSPSTKKKKKKAKEVVGTEVPKWAQKLKQALVRV